jgi:O-antigen/teichoic acid export membrane protein
MREMDKSNPGFTVRLVRNVIWNFAGQGWMLILAFFTTPFIVRSLNVTYYGIFALIGVIIGYFSFLQLGLGTAAVKYISQYLAKNEVDKIKSTFWTCLLAFVALGLAGSWLISSSAKILIGHFFNIPQELKPVATHIIKLGSLGFMISMLLGLTAGVIQALGRFDILNRIGIILVTVQTVTTVALLKMGFFLQEIVIASLIIQLLGVYLYWLNIKKLIPYITDVYIDVRGLSKLLKFGGFVTVSSVLVPVLSNIEKLFIASLRSVASLTYYSIPFAFIDRLTMIRSALSSVLMPTFSYFQESQEKRINKELHYLSTLYILFLYAFFVYFFIIFGRPFLKIWIGSDFAEKSYPILVVLSCAGVINSLAVPSAAVLNGLEKPQYPAIFNIIETLLYVPFCFFLVKKYGALGAAWAWCLRVMLDTLLLNFASCNLLKVGIIELYRKISFRAFIPVASCGLFFLILKNLNLAFLSLLNIIGVVLIFVSYCFSVWRWGLDSFGRARLLDAMHEFSKRNV